MRHSNWTKTTMALLAVMTMAFIACDDDEVTGPKDPVYPADALVAKRVTTPPTPDAGVDAFWGDIQGIKIATEVAPYDFMVDGHDIWWDGYEGQTMDVVMKSVYTDTDIYFLVTWNDLEDSRKRQAWYCYMDDGTDVWLQMGKKHPDEFGNPPAYEDKFTVFWNISIPDFDTKGCAALCHGQYMATNGDGQKADIWHWKRNRTGPVSQLDDKWLDNAQNGRHADAGTGSYRDNSQDLLITGGETVKAPIYWIPGRTDYHWILQSEIDDGTARRIVDRIDNDWIDEDGTVLERTLFHYDSDLVIPSLIGIKPATGSRGDVTVWHNWDNGRWTLKIKRARDTLAEDDVQFTDLRASYWFSIGVMDAAAIAHATPDGYTGTAYRLVLAGMNPPE